MFGGAYSDAGGDLLKSCQNLGVTQGSATNNAFDFMLGGGIDIPVRKSIACTPGAI
jgi:hypothetical protein